MAFFKKTTHTLLKELNKIDIKIPKINYHFKNLYTDILHIYKSIDLKDASINYKLIELQTNQKKTCLVDIIKHLFKTNKLMKCLSHNTKKEQESLFSILNEMDEMDEMNEMGKLNEWINQYGSKFMRKVYILANTNKLPTELFNSHIDNDVINEFVSMDIINYLLNYMDCKHIYTINYEKITLNLTIYGCHHLKKKKRDMIIKIILMMALYKSNFKYKSNLKQTITIDLFLTPFKKKLNSSNKLLGPREINSGFTSPGYKLCIFRNEELYKVLIHEMIHYLDLDLGFLKSNTMYNHLNIHPNIEIRLNEAYTELIALVIISIIHSYHQRKNMALYKTILNDELRFSLYNVSKLLVYFGFDSADDFFSPYKSDQFKQTTSVCSYFVIKTALLFNLNNDTITEEYMIQCLTQEFKNTINSIMNQIKEKKQSKVLFNTLRMSLYEFN